MPLGAAHLAPAPKSVTDSGRVGFCSSSVGVSVGTGDWVGCGVGWVEVRVQVTVSWRSAGDAIEET